MHVRAYNYWCSLLDGRDFPSIEDLEPGDIQDFGPHSVLLDFTEGRDNPATPYIGTAIREECGIGDDIKSIADVPSRSLLSRLTDHYMQIIANRAPVGFEAEFVNQRGRIDLLSRHPDAVQLGRRHDRFHLRRDQLEGPRRGRRAGAGHPRRPCRRSSRRADEAEEDDGAGADAIELPTLTELALRDAVRTGGRRRGRAA